LIYPDWWGGYEESIDHKAGHYQKKSPEEEDARSWNKREMKPPLKKQRDDNSLDKRLQEAKEAAAQLEKMFAMSNLALHEQQAESHSRKRAHFKD
jgi:hypothetical protein